MNAEGNINYSFPVGKDDFPVLDEDLVKATAKVENRFVSAEVQAKRIVSNLNITKSRAGRVLVYTNDTFEYSTGSRTERRSQTDYGSCYLKAIFNQATRSLVDYAGLCPTSQSETSDSSSEKSKKGTNRALK